MILRGKDGRFLKGSMAPNGFKKGVLVRENHPRWKGGKPLCIVCSKQLTRADAIRCREHKFTQEVRKKMSDAKIISSKNSRGNHWKGMRAGYPAKHRWLRKNYGTPQRCDHCPKTQGRFEWANISGKYKREIYDYKRLCKQCHSKYDKEKRKL